MEVHASPAALPELQAFLGGIQVRLRRPEGREALARYTTGLLTELPQKNGETIAQAVWLERRQRNNHTRQGRVSAPFPPSAKAPAHAPASRAS